MNMTAAEPSVDRRPGRGPKTRIRLPWVLVAATAFLMATVSVLWALGRVADRRDVLMLRQPVSIGESITDEMLTTTQVALDDGYSRVYSPEQRSLVVGAVASIDLEAGDLLGPTVLNRKPLVSPDERLVGAKLPQGLYPPDLRQGDQAVVVATFNPEVEERQTATARIVDITISETAEAVVTLAVSTADAPKVAVWAGNSSMVIVSSPQGAGS
jgi:hypothetical protein